MAGLGAMVFGGVPAGTPPTQRRHSLRGRPLRPGQSRTPSPPCRRSAAWFSRANTPTPRLMAGKSMMAQPLRQMPYETAGRFVPGLSPKPSPVTNYRRDLDLDTAIARVSYTADGVDLHPRSFLQRRRPGHRGQAYGGQAGPHFLHRHDEDAAKGDRPIRRRRHAAHVAASTAPPKASRAR